MSRRWKQICTGMLCAVFTIAIASVSAGEEPISEARPKVEFSVGTWISAGDTRWAHNASAVAGLGNPTSKLTYKDVGTNVIDLTGKFWFSPNVFGRLNGGFADIGGGRLTDDDYGTGQRLDLRTISNLSGNNMYYINADIGARVKEFAINRGSLDIFAGYQYWHTEHRAVGLGVVACNPAVFNCSAPLPAPDETIITNTANWHSIRAGASTEYRLTRRLSLIAARAPGPLRLHRHQRVGRHHCRASRSNIGSITSGWRSQASPTPMSCSAARASLRSPRACRMRCGRSAACRRSTAATACRRPSAIWTPKPRRT